MEFDIYFTEEEALNIAAGTYLSSVAWQGF
jgi:hypothetical protein